MHFLMGCRKTFLYRVTKNLWIHNQRAIRLPLVRPGAAGVPVLPLPASIPGGGGGTKVPFIP